MNKAFDVIFQTEVDAETIAKTLHNSEGERFRYQCLCCGEEVYLAAADSTEKAPHFRHRRGNNDIDCERYLGHPGAIEHYVSIRKHNMEHILFGFNIENMTFEAAVMYTDEEMKKCNMEAKQLSLYTQPYLQPFFTLPINRENIIPNVWKYFTLKEYANDYYISKDGDNKKILYTNIIKKDYKLNIYRIKQSDCHYMRNDLEILYTDEHYLAISEDADNIRKITTLQTVEIDGDIETFKTQGRQFYLVKFSIQFIDYSTKIYFLEQEFKIEIAETMDILWPPVFTEKSVSYCTAKKICVSPSFELILHGNVEGKDTSIKKITNGVYEISFEDEVNIFEKNIKKTIIKKENLIRETTYEKPEIIYVDKKYEVSDNYDYYLFDKQGCRKLIAGSNIYMAENDRIVGYKNGHIKVVVFTKPKKVLDKQILINDILKYHPQCEAFELDDYMDIEMDEVVLTYIEECYRNGMINTVIKRYIKEGLI